MTDDIIVTSRSAVADYLTCPRKRWIGYEAPNGTEGPVRGWQRRKLAIPLATGSYVHRIVEGLLRGDEVEGTVMRVVESYRTEVRERGVAAEVETDEIYVVNEQAALIEALGRAWARVRLPKIIEEFEVLTIEGEPFVERELPVRLADDVILATRCDAVLVRKYDGKWFIYNPKTTAEASTRWYQGWEVDMQLMTETLAVEQRLGTRVSGYMVEGFEKGKRVGVDEIGHEVRGGDKSPIRYVQRSPLIYGWKFDGNPPLEPLAYDWQSSRKKGWHRFGVWEEMAFGATPVGHWVNWLPPEVVEAQFAVVPPILRDEAATHSKARQIVGMERRIREARQMVGEFNLDEGFPQNERSCLWPTRCQFFDCCWTGNVGADIGGSGLFVPRVSNHPIEGEGGE